MDPKFKPMTAYRNESSYATWDIYITRITEITETEIGINYLFMDRLGFIRDLPMQKGRILFKDFDDWQEVEYDIHNNKTVLT